jgi:hypothetical protein
MKVKEYPFVVTVKDCFGGKKVYTVTDKVTGEIIIITHQKNFLKNIEKSFFMKKTVDS